MKKIINKIPNAITISRIISCVIGAVLFTMGNVVPSLIFYIYGAVSDAFDGFLARKLNAVSEFGKKIDPISDKLYALSLMTPSIILGNYLMILPLLFEGIISGINIYSDIKYKNTHTEKVGKIKTIMLFPTMILGLLAIFEPYVYIAFVPSLYVSLKLQTKSIEVYIKQLNELEKNYYEKNEVNIQNIDNSINKCNICKHELNEINIKKNKKSKAKILVRKKD